MITPTPGILRLEITNGGGKQIWRICIMLAEVSGVARDILILIYNLAYVVKFLHIMDTSTKFNILSETFVYSDTLFVL